MFILCLQGNIKEHIDIFGGALVSGHPEVILSIAIRENMEESMVEVKAMDISQRNSDSQTSEVRDTVKRLDIGVLLSVL